MKEMLIYRQLWQPEFVHSLIDLFIDLSQYASLRCWQLLTFITPSLLFDFHAVLTSSDTCHHLDSPQCPSSSPTGCGTERWNCAPYQHFFVEHGDDGPCIKLYRPFRKCFWLYYLNARIVPWEKKCEFCRI